MRILTYTASSAYTDHFWLICGWQLAKKIAAGLVKNLLNGKANAFTNVAIYFLDVIIFIWKGVCLSVSICVSVSLCLYLTRSRRDRERERDRESESERQTERERENVCVSLTHGRTHSHFSQIFLHTRSCSSPCPRPPLASPTAPFRDNVVNFAQALTSLSNFVAILIASLTISVPKDALPTWATEGIIMWLVVAGTGLQTVVALLGPVFAFFGVAFQVSGYVTSCCLLGDKASVVTKSLAAAMWVRFQMICMNRTKAKLKRDREESDKAKKLEKELGDSSLGDSSELSPSSLKYLLSLIEE